MEESTQNNINPVRNTNFPQHQNKISNGVKCSVFRESDEVIKNIISKFGKASSKEKQYYAQDILTEVKALSSCPNYNARNPDCISCRSISRKYLQEYESLSKIMR